MSSTITPDFSCTAAQVLLGLHQVLLRVLQLLLEEHAALLRFAHRQAAEHLGDLVGMRVGQIGRELRLLVVDLDG